MTCSSAVFWSNVDNKKHVQKKGRIEEFRDPSTNHGVDEDEEEEEENGLFYYMNYEGALRTNGAKQNHCKLS